MSNSIPAAGERRAMEFRIVENQRGADVVPAEVGDAADRGATLRPSRAIRPGCGHERDEALVGCRS